MRIIMQGDREERPAAHSILKQEETLCHRDALCGLHSVFLCVTGACALILRRGYVEAVTQGENDGTRVVVLSLNHLHAAEVECAVACTLVEEVAARQLDVEATLEQVFADAK